MGGPLRAKWMGVQGAIWKGLKGAIWEGLVYGGL